MQAVTLSTACYIPKTREGVTHGDFMPVVRISVEAYNKLSQLSKNQDKSKVLNNLILQQENNSLLTEAFKKFLQASGMLNNTTGPNRFQDAIDVLEPKEEKPKYHKEQFTCYKCQENKTCSHAWDVLNLKPNCTMMGRFSHG